MKKFILYFFFILYCSSLQAANFKKYAGSGELKLSENTFDILEFYLSTGKYGSIYNNPTRDWQKKLTKSVWKPMFFLVSENGRGKYWYYSLIGSEILTTPDYLNRARGRCKQQGHGECFVFAVRDKIVWQNGLNPKKGTRIKKKDAKNGMVLSKLTELGFYDGGKTTSSNDTIKKKPKITKKKPTDNVDIVKQLKELNSLLESGIISAEEFAKAKKKVLSN